MNFKNCKCITSKMPLPLFHHTLFLWCTVATTVAVEHHRLVFKLIHRHSVLSPYYDPSATVSELARQDTETSTARYAYLKARTKVSDHDHDHDHDHVQVRLIPEDAAAAFLVRFSIGEPPVPQLTIIDTGSTLLWLQCLPCSQCFPQLRPLFDPSNSSTFARLPCDSTYCNSRTIDFKCDQAPQLCTYTIAYADGSTSEGDVGTEKLTVETSDEGTTGVDGVVFGCGHRNSVGFGRSSGVLGLGFDKASLAVRLGSKFSYCIGDIYDHHYRYNQLIIGEGTKIEGNSTPIEVHFGLYYLTLNGISVGDRLLDIAPSMLERRKSGEGGLVIDTGSTLSYLVLPAYAALSQAVQEEVGGRLREEQPPFLGKELCYYGNVSEDMTWFPTVTFHLGEEADLVLGPTNMFRQRSSEVFCMAVAVSRIKHDINVIGIMAQQYYNFAYDLNAMKLYFQSIDCQLLET